MDIITHAYISGIIGNNSGKHKRRNGKASGKIRVNVSDKLVGIAVIVGGIVTCCISYLFSRRK